MERKGTWFSRFARSTSTAMGKPITFILSVLLVVVWLVVGPIFQWSETWQLVINTLTTIVTFWMVFVIQNSQNRDTQAIQLKLDELIKAMEMADNSLIDSELLEDRELEELRKKYCELAASKRRSRGKEK
jgi:low affinity Fe/Cu permease